MFEFEYYSRSSACSSVRKSKKYNRGISVCCLLPEHLTNVWAWSGMKDHLYRRQVFAFPIELPWRLVIGPELGRCLSQRAGSATITRRHCIFYTGCRRCRAMNVRFDGGLLKVGVYWSMVAESRHIYDRRIMACFLVFLLFVLVFLPVHYWTRSMSFATNTSCDSCRDHGF